MDFSKIDLKKASNGGAECQLNHPVTGKPLFTEKGEKITISILGRDSDAFRSIVSEIAERETGASTVDGNDANAIEILVAIITGWNHIKWGESELEFTPENVRMFLTKFPPIRIQLDVFVAKRANFFKDAKTK